MPPPHANEAEQDEIEIALRDPAAVTRRVVLLGAVCRRAFLEADRANEAGDPEAERFDLAAWVRAEGLADDATATERRFLDARIGRLDHDAAVAASWSSEALAELAWALGLLAEAPAFDRPAAVAAVLERLPQPWDSPRAFVGAAALRDEEAIARERERAELWHWRAEAERTARSGGGADVAHLRAAIREVAGEARSAGLLPPLADADFPVHAGPYRGISDALLLDLSSLAEERLRALNWLCGFGADWDRVPLDV